MDERQQSRRMEQAPGHHLDSFSLYLNDIGRVPLLSKEEEYDLACQVQAGKEATALLENLGFEERNLSEEECENLERIQNLGLRAREHMISANLRLTVALVSKYHVSRDKKLDLIQEGNEGLFRAVDKFDPTLGYKFSTYAVWHIRQRINIAFKNDTNIHVPHHVIERDIKIEKARQELARHGGEVTEEDISDYTKLSLEQIRGVRLFYPKFVGSLNERIGEGTTEIGDLVADPKSEEAFDASLKDIWQKSILGKVQLDKRERFIIERLCGLDGDEPETLESVGKTLGITRERVRQIREAVRKKILKQLDPEDIESLLDRSQ